ncbi:hypothetical protein OB905_09360 [Halobacteria archaeon AArc-dxtr1]|nr:hypothetical protein [Halobacteria archaeon AArc-dxtr1]
MQRRTFVATLSALAAGTAGIASGDAENEETIAPLTSQADGSHHPGPPRFLHAGEEIADPLGTVANSPTESRAGRQTRESSRLSAQWSWSCE